MTIYGYARVSTDDQSCEIQVDKLTAGGAELIRSENVSGTSLEGRTELRNLMDFVRQGDTLLITRIDRLSRSIKDIQNIVSELDEKGVILRATEQPIDTGSATSKLFLNLLVCFADFETSIRKERQLEGIAKAKKLGVYKGRKRSVDAEKIRELRSSGMNPSAIAKSLGISRVSVYRYLD